MRVRDKGCKVEPALHPLLYWRKEIGRGNTENVRRCITSVNTEMRQKRVYPTWMQKGGASICERLNLLLFPPLSTECDRGVGAFGFVPRLSGCLYRGSGRCDLRREGEQHLGDPSAQR